MATVVVDGSSWFRRFWVASSVSAFGTYVTTVALQVLVVDDLGGSATEVGLVNAARWAPYLLVGLLVGVLTDRLRRRPVLVVTDLGRAVVLAGIPLLAVLDRLTLPALLVLVAVLGLLSLGNDAAHQSFLPRLVPRSGLSRANARLQQSDAAAQTSGPALGGLLVALLGAPLAVLVDAASYLLSGVLTASIRTVELVPEREQRHLRRELVEGVRWVYRHRTLAPLAWSTHAWFLFFSVLGAVYAPFVLTTLGRSPLALGITLALAGVGGLVGVTASARVTAHVGLFGTMATGRLAEATGIAVIATAVVAPEAALVLLGAGQLLVGLGLGVEGPVDITYRQAITPDRLQGRMNTTMRSANRSVIVLAAPLGGLLADRAGPGVALAVSATGIALTVIALSQTGFRTAHLDDAPPQGTCPGEPDTT
ncbi:MFS family permease [Nakamurella sp. UYEF19]|uniref:MFS transporter n=1 Tax=Nakamurella sp. UYEF19 TaxID=1756392 RepID=UPI0033962D8C